jgi:hypothetical protein
MFLWRASSRAAWIGLVVYELAVVVIIHLLSTRLVSIDPATLWVPDITFGYSAESLFDLYHAMGSHGRELYLSLELFDTLIYSHGYALLLSSLLSWSSAQKLSMLPWIAWTFDVVENAAQVHCLLWLESEMSDTWSKVAFIGSYANMAKWTLFGMSFVLLAWQLIQNRFQAKGHAKKH